MIGGVLVYLRKQLDGYLRAQLPEPGDDPAADKVVFLDGDKMEPISFQEGAVTELLINIEEERQLRAADPYVGIRPADPAAGIPVAVPLHKQPDLRLVLHILFVARFKQYDIAWDHLAKILEYLQWNPAFERDAYPDLPAGVGKLTFELVTQSFHEQNDVWNALRTTYHPSALYRVRLVVLQDARPTAQTPINPRVFNVRRKLPDSNPSRDP